MGTSVGMNYYNEWDEFAAAWLRNLIFDGLIPWGEVDTRSIADVKATDLKGYRQCHFFAGIGGWALALQLAGLSSDDPVWTGSCPCQPFSAAGKQKGEADKRHLWPEFRRLIAECKPATVFGEQVASRLGREWLAGVRADLEALGYAVGSADLCAAGVGAPHIRQRLYWMAVPESEQHDGSGNARGGRGESSNGGDAGERMGNADNARSQGRDERGDGSGERAVGASGVGGWNGANDWIHCIDGKARRTQSSLFPLAHGVSGRVGRLRAYGNAIVPQVAAHFIKAALECRP